MKHRFDGDLRVSLTDSTTVELTNAYALDHTLHGTAESGRMEIPIENITGVEEKRTPEGFSTRAFVVVGLLVVGLVIGATSAVP